MNKLTAELSRKVEDLLDVLEGDAAHIEKTLSYLNELRCFVIKRDEKNLGRLLEEIRNESREYSANERRRRMIREQIANILGCKTQELTLSVLRSRLHELAKKNITEKQERLRALTQQLQREYIATAALLGDCARINSRLLKIVFERSRSGLVCYDSQGETARESGSAFMSMHI